MRRREGMRLPARLARRLIGWLLPARDAGLVAELDGLHAERVTKRGPGAADAWYVRQAIGFAGRLAGARVWEGMDALRQDTAFGLRAAARSPLFTMLAVVTLALGVGANAAVFGVVKSVLLDPLPYTDDGRLVRVQGLSTEGSGVRPALSAGAVFDYSTRQRSFERMAAFYPTTWEVIYRPESGPRVLSGALFTPGFLETLGVSPIVGRTFTDGETPNAGVYAVLLSHDLWRAEFGADPGVVGKSIRVDGNTWQIFGVLPRGFIGPMGSADVWFTLDLSSSLSDPVGSRRSEWLGLVARLRPGITAAVAGRELSAIASALAREHPDSDAGRSVAVVSLRDSMVGDTRTLLLVLMASSLLVLIIACANLAGGLLSRTIARRSELAVRVALGAGRGRLIRQLLTESTLLAVAGSLAGLLLASLALGVLRGLDVPALPVYADLSLDAGAILVAAAVALCTGLAIGIVPATAALRSNLQQTFRDAGRGVSEGLRSSRLRGMLMAGQLALSLSLLVGAGLLARSLVAMTRDPLGFDPDGVLTVSVKGPVPASDAVRKQFFNALEEGVGAAPGVIAVANASQLPGPAMSRSDLAIEGRVSGSETRPSAIPFVTVSDDWFRTMRIPLLRGRVFGPQDAMNTTPAIVVSEAMAREYWPDGNAIGARVRLGSTASEPWAEVVGIVGDIRTDPTRIVPEPMAWGAARQSMMRESRVYVLRAERDPLALALPFRSELTRLDPSVPMNDVGTLDAILDANLNARRLPALLMTAFALLALVLASAGVYALFASLAAAREPEFGIRMALGSTPTAIAALILRQGAIWTVAGLAGGAIGVVVVGRMVRDLLYGVSGLDPITIGLAVLALVASGTLALLIPVRRVTRLDARAVLR